MKAYQPAFDDDTLRVPKAVRTQPPTRRILLTAGTSAEMWMPVILGLLVAGVVRLLP